MRLIGALALALALGASAQAQLGERNQLGLRMGHVHMLVRDVDAHKLFFTEMLGGRIVRNGSLELIEFPGIYVILTQAQEPVHPSGALIDHFGFMVKDFPTHLAKWQAAGVQIEPLENPNEVYVLTPDRVRVEVYGQPAVPEPIFVTHVHYYVPDVPAIRAWYVDVFGANPSRRPCVACISQPRMHPTVDIGMLNLTMVPATTQRAPATRGSSIDHVGFDVENLDAFVRALEARGVTPEGPVQQIPGTSVKSVFFTDPWGTRIELTEGLAPP